MFSEELSIPDGFCAVLYVFTSRVRPWAIQYRVVCRPALGLAANTARGTATYGKRKAFLPRTRDILSRCRCFHWQRDMFLWGNPCRTRFVFSRNFQTKQFIILIMDGTHGFTPREIPSAEISRSLAGTSCMLLRPSGPQSVFQCDYTGTPVKRNQNERSIFDRPCRIVCHPPPPPVAAVLQYSNRQEDKIVCLATFDAVVWG